MEAVEEKLNFEEEDEGARNEFVWTSTENTIL
jgi:hypothetical protein